MLKTDGNEICYNTGGILFENFYQGCKVYPSKYQMNNPKYLWWKFTPITLSGDIIIDNNNNINYDLYLNWRNSLWNCKNPIRYPNKIFRRKNTKFALSIDNNGNEILEKNCM